MIGKLKHEVYWETTEVAFDLLVEAFGRHTVQRGEIGIEKDLLPPQYVNYPGDVFGAHLRGCVHVSLEHGGQRKSLTRRPGSALGLSAEAPPAQAL